MNNTVSLMLSFQVLGAQYNTVRLMFIFPDPGYPIIKNNTVNLMLSSQIPWYPITNSQAKVIFPDPGYPTTKYSQSNVIFNNIARRMLSFHILGTQL